MFSGFSNQVNSWMGAVKGEPHDEEVPTPTAQQMADAEVAAAAAAAANNSASSSAAAAAAAQPLADGESAASAAAGGGGGGEGVPQAQSPTKAGGMFSGMKTQMSGWLGNAAIPTMPSMPAMPAMPAIPSMPTIPGLRKAGPAAAGATDETAASEAEAALQADGLEAGGGGVGADEEDRSSATEGADSAPVSGQGTPSEEKVGQVEMGKPAATKSPFQSFFERDPLSGTHAVTTKVTQGAKTFGSFLYSAANKAGSKIKESVKSNPILGEFNKEQDAFIRGQPGADAAVAPWIGHPNEEQVKEEILGLSADRRNFVRAPPAGVEFEFNYDVSYPIAVAIMSEDAALEKMRFDLVPKIITEENFWRNYFYRVSLICQASDADAYGAAAAAVGDTNEVGQTTSGEKTAQSATALPSAGALATDAAATVAPPPVASSKRTLSETEFVSDTLRSTDTDLEEVKAGMKLLGIDTLARQSDVKSEEHWENQLESELQDFELVDDGASGEQQTSANGDDANWENDVRDLLGDDCDDLK